MKTETRRPPVVVLLQVHREDEGWTTQAWGVPLDGRRCLLRAADPGAVRPADRVRLLAVSGSGPRPRRTALEAAGVSVLRRGGTGRPDLLAVTLAADLPVDGPVGHGTDARAVRDVVALLADDDRTPWRLADGPDDGDGPAGGPVPVTVEGSAADRTVGPAAAPDDGGDDGGDAPLSWTCRILGIGCPDPQ
ncbi:hypothetical protein GA0070616_0224 [Micromonospora nigra]|uniref:Uncharacterized protein n=1 Tax=Micromonospora nigra TaxID=145857 RepID=A0A1C6R9V7_9ACTN|nr:hypothetical protein [Micromonospora nigra]SCL13736.1 hypothetical protein GA0070616_0224 [Micromonospora nigra]